MTVGRGLNDSWEREAATDCLSEMFWKTKERSYVKKYVTPSPVTLEVR